MPYYVGSIFEVTDTEVDGKINKEHYILTEEGRLLNINNGTYLNDNTVAADVSWSASELLVVHDKKQVIQQGNEFYKVKFYGRHWTNIKGEENGSD